MRRQGRTLVVVDDLSAEELALAAAEGEDVLVTVSHPRNLKHLRLAWALAQRLSEMIPWLIDRDHAMSYLKVRARHIDTIIDGDGEVHVIPRSIAFASLSQAAFKRVFDRMVYVVVYEIVPGLDEEAFRQELFKMVEGPPYPT